MIIKRGYAEKPPISYYNAQERVMLVLKLYDKIDPEKVLNCLPLFTTATNRFDVVFLTNA